MSDTRLWQLVRCAPGVAAVLLLLTMPGLLPATAEPNREVLAWGRNDLGALGDGTSSNRNTPVKVEGPGGTGTLSEVVMVSAGVTQSLALKADGTVWAWGYNIYGELGDGTYTQRLAPVQVLGPSGIGFLDGVAAISAGDGFSLALKSDGTVWTWGSGDIGNGKDTVSLTPVQVVGPGGVDFLTGIVAVSAGHNHALAVKQDGTVWSWGTNLDGQLGDGTTTERLTPVQVVGHGGVGFLTSVKAVAAAGWNGDGYSLALKQDGTVWSWGFGDYGELGGGGGPGHTPGQVVGAGGVGFLTAVKSVVACGSTSPGHALALKQDGTVWAWGYNGYGELGDGSATDRNKPVEVVGPGDLGFLADVTAVSAGDDYGLALKVDGTVWAWGDNSYGELGDGTATERLTPGQVVGPSGIGFLHRIAAISAGGSHNLAIFTRSYPFDFNADGSADLLWQNQSTGGVTAWLMNGTQYSGTGASIADSASWKVVGVADFNGDGSPDLVWQNPANGAVYVWFMNGLQYSGAGGSVVSAADPSWKVVGTPDLNGDGHPDILWQNTSTGAVAYWLMNGTQYAGQSGTIVTSADPAWKIVGTPDMNSDGYPDILWQNSTTGGVYVWYMNGVTYSGTGTYIVSSTDPSWHVVGVPDLNGDGQPDLLWQNGTTGGVLYWLMNGATYTGQGDYIVSSTDPNWQITGIH